MKKVRIAFLLASFALFALAIFLLNPSEFFTPAPVQRPGKVSPLVVTDVSGSGRVWLDDGETQALDLHQPPAGETRLKADALTSFEFIFRGTQFTALPGSVIHYVPQTQDLTLLAGEFYWKRLGGREKAEVALRQPETLVVLSESGRLLLRADAMTFWNFAGQLSLRSPRQTATLEPLQMLQTGAGSERRTSLLPAPPFISPQADQVELNTLSDAVIGFKWKAVPGARHYALRLYSSRLRENLLLARQVNGNSLALDVLPYLASRELYWDVAAVDDRNGVEAVPSVLGSIRVSGSLLVSDQLPQPPRLTIDSLSVSGNMVLIKGSTDASNQLVVNDVPIKLDGEGKFVHTLSFRTIGVKDILFRITAPSGMESVVKRQVTIFEEISEE